MENPITTPLPADLPENWTNEQIVSAGGTEAGLSEQHGYNYLMRQVNAAQEGVNSLGEAQAQLETDVETLQTNVERWDTAAYNVDDLLDGTKKAAHAEYADAVGDIDCGIWDLSEVEIHNETPLSHQNLKIDGNVSGGEDSSQTLEEHMQNPTAHQNLVIDGNAGQ